MKSPDRQQPPPASCSPEGDLLDFTGSSASQDMLTTTISFVSISGAQPVPSMTTTTTTITPSVHDMVQHRIPHPESVCVQVTSASSWEHVASMLDDLSRQINAALEVRRPTRHHPRGHAEVGAVRVVQHSRHENEADERGVFQTTPPHTLQCEGQAAVSPSPICLSQADTTHPRPGLSMPVWQPPTSFKVQHHPAPAPGYGVIPHETSTQMNSAAACPTTLESTTGVTVAAPVGPSTVGPHQRQQSYWPDADIMNMATSPAKTSGPGEHNGPSIQNRDPVAFSSSPFSPIPPPPPSSTRRLVDISTSDSSRRLLSRNHSDSHSHDISATAGDVEKGMGLAPNTLSLQSLPSHLVSTHLPTQDRFDRPQALSYFPQGPNPAQSQAAAAAADYSTAPYDSSGLDHVRSWVVSTSSAATPPLVDRNVQRGATNGGDAFVPAPGLVPPTATPTFHQTITPTPSAPASPVAPTRPVSEIRKHLDRTQRKRGGT